MIAFDIRQIFPDFILNDKNGYAMARALEAGLRYFLEHVQDGVDCVLDVDKMPEWRLDELAWEYNILYDYTAEISIKRQWIGDAIQFYSLYGTPEGVVRYLKAAFDTVNLEEWWQYNGDPYHFRVTVTGEWTQHNDEWGKRAINEAKNARSVLDGLIFNAGESEATIHIGGNSAGIEIEAESRTL